MAVDPRDTGIRHAVRQVGPTGTVAAANQQKTVSASNAPPPDGLLNVRPPAPRADGPWHRPNVDRRSARIFAGVQQPSRESSSRSTAVSPVAPPHGLPAPVRPERRSAQRSDQKALRPQCLPPPRRSSLDPLHVSRSFCGGPFRQECVSWLLRRRQRNGHDYSKGAVRRPRAGDTLHAPTPSPEGSGQIVHGTASGPREGGVPHRPAAGVRL
jgi:hypothetical protein